MDYKNIKFNVNDKVTLKYDINKIVYTILDCSDIYNICICAVINGKETIKVTDGTNLELVTN